MTADEPPASDDCSAAYVWGIRIYDSGQTFSARGDDPTCLFRRTYEFGYRLDVCRTVRDDGRELTSAEYLADAQDFGDKADAIWCGLASAAIAGTLFDTLDACEDVNIGEFVVNSAQGDRISGTGTLKVTYPCRVGS